IPSLDGVWDIQEYVAQTEALGDALAETLDAERLRCVVPGGDQMQTELVRVGSGALAHFAGEQGVRASGGGVGEVVAAGARHDRDAPHVRGPGAEHERLTRGDLTDARDELIGRHAPAGKRGEAADRLAVVQSKRLPAPRARGGRREGGVFRGGGGGAG